jgi:hypothetical protein
MSEIKYNTAIGNLEKSFIAPMAAYVAILETMGRLMEQN